MEKGPAYVEEPNGVQPPIEHADQFDARDGAIANEAKDMYGDIQTAEQYGYVSRGYAHATRRPRVPTRLTFL